MINMYVNKRMVLFIMLFVLMFSFFAKYIAYGKQYVFGDKIYNNGINMSTLNNTNTMYRFFDGSVKERTLVLQKIKNTGTKPLDVWVTAYTSDPNETDDTPFITASGSTVRDGVAAANFLPIGTEFTIPDKFGNKTFVVEDRMNQRYDNQYIVDLWFADKDNAKIFGKRYLKIEIL